MKRLIIVAAGLLLVMSAAILVRSVPSPNKRPQDDLKGQMNTSLVFYGKVVDQDGRPLAGAVIEYRVESYPNDWTFETRARLNDASTVVFTSDQNGMFQKTITGCTMRKMSATLPGYRPLSELKLRSSTEQVQNDWYRLIAQGDLWFKSDPDNPAVYVFVKDGIKEVSALPCHGGYSSGGTYSWTRNEPGWPKQPSLKDVIQKLPTTAPATAPTR